MGNDLILGPPKQVYMSATGPTLSDCPEVVSRFSKDGLGTPSLLSLIFLWFSVFSFCFLKSEYKALLFRMEKL